MKKSKGGKFTANIENGASDKRQLVSIKGGVKVNHYHYSPGIV